MGLPPATAVFNKLMGIDDSVKHPSPEPRDDFVGAVPFAGDERYTHTAFVAERTIDFLQQQDGKRPFLCIAGFYSPHAPWVVPQCFLDLYQEKTFTIQNSQFTIHHLSPVHGYYAMISEVDHHIGRILAVLEQQGLADNTIIIFTSDHGEWLGDNGRFGKGYPGDDPVTRVPLIVKAPEINLQSPISGLHSPFVESVDVLPTILDLAGIQIPPHLNGRSFAGLIQKREYTPRDSALTEFNGWKTLRTAQHRYLIHQNGEEMLWNELGDVVQDDKLLAEHRHLLLQRVLDAERPHPRIWPY